MKILRLSLILFYNPGICYLLTLREGKLCHLMQSCHKNIQDPLCFQFSSGKDGTVAQLCHKIISSWYTWSLYQNIARS